MGAGRGLGRRASENVQVRGRGRRQVLPKVHAVADPPRRPDAQNQGRVLLEKGVQAGGRLRGCAGAWALRFFLN